MQHAGLGVNEQVVAATVPEWRPLENKGACGIALPLPCERDFAGGDEHFYAKSLMTKCFDSCAHLRSELDRRGYPSKRAGVPADDLSLRAVCAIECNSDVGRERGASGEDPEERWYEEGAVRGHGWRG